VEILNGFSRLSDLSVAVLASPVRMRR